MKNQKWLEYSGINTQELRDRLKHCIGRNTVEIYRDEYGNIYCYHYGALICVLGHYKRVLYNSPYFDYSASTSRVRNEFMRMFGLPVYTTQYLRKCVNEQNTNGDIINRNIVAMRMSERSTFVSVEDINIVLNMWGD